MEYADYLKIIETQRFLDKKDAEEKNLSLKKIVKQTPHSRDGALLYSNF